MDAPLLPKVARRDPKQNSTPLERKMLLEFRRRLAREPDIARMDNWDLLAFAQHHGLYTRLLDWTTNPLFGLWFACADDPDNNSDAFIYLLSAEEEALLNTAKEKDPFSIKKTYVMRPNVNSARIRAQSGWFTVHRYSKEAGMFVDLHKNTSLTGQIIRKRIPARCKLPILITLDRLGVNEESVYPGPEGTAHYLNWLRRHRF